MRWIKACLHHRLAIYLSAIAICIAGLVSLYVMPIAPGPTLSFNDMNITFYYPGANANTVQSQVITKVSNALQGVPNIKTLRATSLDGAAQIQLTLNSMAPDVLLQTQMQVMQAIAASHLPAAVPQPQIKIDQGTDTLMQYALSSEQLSTFQIYNYIQSQMVPKFSSIPGVDLDVDSMQPTLLINFSPEQLALYHIDPLTLSETLNQEFSSQPLGKLYIAQQPYLLGFSRQLQTISDFGQLIIGQREATATAAANFANLSSAIGSQPLRLQDVAQVTFAPRDLVPNSVSYFNGKIAGSIHLYTTGAANPFQVKTATDRVVKQLQQHAPADLKITITNDITKVMLASFHEVALSIGIASILVLLIALIFLGHLRTTLVPIVTIPVCLLGALVVVNSLGYSLNVLTLLALVIAVGLVVDDAIVVVENITRHLEEGMSRFEAVTHGSADIALTIIGITATLLAVYLPIAFVSGSAFMTLLKAFAVPLAAAVFFSGIVALTLTPVMCDKLLVIGADNAFQRVFNACLASVIRGYQAILKLVLQWRYIALGIVVALIVAGAYADMHLEQKFFPDDPWGDVAIQITGGPEDNPNTLSQKLEQFAPFYKSKQVDFYEKTIETDPSSGQLIAKFWIHYKDQYLHQVLQHGSQIKQFIKQHKLENTTARAENFSNMGNGSDIDVSLYAAQGIAAVNAAATHLTNLLRKSALFEHVENTIQAPRKQFAFDIDIVKAVRHGITRQQITQLLSVAYGGYQLNNSFNIAGLTVPVVVRLDAGSLHNPQALQSLQITSAQGKHYPLSEFVTLQMVAKPMVLTSVNSQPSVDLQLDLAAGASLKEAIPYLNSQLAAHAASISYQYNGSAAEFLAGSHQTLLVAILGILCIYFLLALLFRSLLDPFIILLTVPFSVVFGAASLFVLHGSLNIYSTLALITLIGLITKHGVLIVQFANHELHRGASVREALLAATHHRFRPIIMTTLAMTFGALPLLLSSGAMYVARQDLAVVLIGGLVIGTLFSLFVVPLMYSLLKREPIKADTALLTK